MDLGDSSKAPRRTEDSYQQCQHLLRSNALSGTGAACVAELRSAWTAEGGYAYAFSGFQRSTGLRAAAVSSRREMRVLCGASSTNCGSSSTSSAIDFMASMNRSSSSLGSLSVGSIISAPGTISGNAVV